MGVKSPTASSPLLTPHQVQEMPTVFEMENRSLPLCEEPDTAETPEVVKPKLKRQVHKTKPHKRRSSAVGSTNKTRRGKQPAPQPIYPSQAQLLDQIPIRWQVQAKMLSCSRLQVVLLLF